MDDRYVVIDMRGVTLESEAPSREEASESLEGNALDMLKDLGVDTTEAETTKLVVEKGLKYVDIRANGTRYRTVVMAEYLDSEYKLPVWHLELRQY